MSAGKWKSLDLTLEHVETLEASEQEWRDAAYRAVERAELAEARLAESLELLSEWIGVCMSPRVRFLKTRAFLGEVSE